jgi:predicted dehydrogenase
MSSVVRLGIVGLGNMGSDHVRSIPHLQRVELAAVCDIVPDKLAKYDLPGFTDSGQMIRSGKVDAVLIATPHYFHTTIGIDALDNGIHVLTEKPISVHKADCERLIAAHDRNPKQVFAAMFNQRTDPHYQKLRNLVRSGELGEIQRVNWIITDWFRSAAYYASGGWRATWGGEGGGVLLNQCPHNLDLLQWICGMPSKVRAYCSFGKYHDIEVEDEVTAYLEYPNGATGVFITTTGEAPGTNRLEIAGDRGKAVLERGEITFYRTAQSVAEFRETTKESFAAPELWECKIPARGYGGQHREVLQNFVDTILDGGQVIAPAEEGIHSVELANAMLLSAFLDQTIEVPLDGSV